MPTDAAQVESLPVPRPAASKAATIGQKLWYPGVEPPAYLDGTMAGDYGFDPLGLGADADALAYYRQAELQHCRYAMLGVAGIVAAELARPGVFWYEAALPKNLPGWALPLNALAIIQIAFMHFAEFKRKEEMKKGAAGDGGYPGGAFDPAGWSKKSGFDLANQQTKELKNGRLAMVAFVGCVIQAQATGMGALEGLRAHLSDPLNNNIVHNIGACTISPGVDIDGIIIRTPCLWPGGQ